MYLTSEFVQWLENNSENGKIDIELLKEKLKNFDPTANLPTCTMRFLKFVNPDSVQHSWVDIDSKSYFIVLSDYTHEKNSSLFNTTIEDLDGNKYLVEDIDFGGDSDVLLVKYLEE